MASMYSDFSVQENLSFKPRGGTSGATRRHFRRHAAADAAYKTLWVAISSQRGFLPPAHFEKRLRV